MANPNNNGTLVGRVAQDIKEFPNADGSKTLLVTLAVDNNFTSGPDRKVKTQFIPLRVFIPASMNGLGPWTNIGKGDLISVNTRLVCEPYMKDGELVYPNAATVEVDGFPQFLEPKSVTDARRARHAVAATDESGAAAEGVNERIAQLEAELAAERAKGQDLAEATSPFAGAAA